MTRSRWVVFSSTVIVGLGSLAALGAFALDPARAAVGPLPAEAMALPADTTFIMGFDVQKFVASPFYQKYGQKYGRGDGGARPQAFAELEEKTGINPERDLDRVVLSGGKTAGDNPSGLALVTGRFDRYKLGRALEANPAKTVTWRQHQGITVYILNETSKGAGAFAFLDDHTLIMGSRRAVESTIESKVRNGLPLRSNAMLMDLAATLKPGSTFWMVGDQTILSKLPRGIPGANSGDTIQLPPLKSLVITGEMDPIIALEAVGEAADEAAAKNLADVVRGLTALASLSANQRPELKELASAVSVSSEATHVRVNANFTYELLDALQKKQVATTPPAAPAK